MDGVCAAWRKPAACSVYIPCATVCPDPISSCSSGAGGGRGLWFFRSCVGPQSPSIPVSAPWGEPRTGLPGMAPVHWLTEESVQHRDAGSWWKSWTLGSTLMRLHWAITQHVTAQWQMKHAGKTQVFLTEGFQAAHRHVPSAGMGGSGVRHCGSMTGSPRTESGWERYTWQETPAGAPQLVVQVSITTMSRQDSATPGQGTRRAPHLCGILPKPVARLVPSKPQTNPS